MHKKNVSSFPFKASLSFETFFSHWQNKKNDPNESIKVIAEELDEMVEKNFFLLKPIENISIIQSNPTVFYKIINLILPVSLMDEKVAAIVSPFTMEPIFQSPAFIKIINTSEIVSSSWDSLIRTYDNFMAIKAYAFVLKQFYGMETLIDIPQIFEARDKESGISRSYLIDYDTTFVNIVCKGTVPELTSEEKTYILENLTDVEFLKEKISPIDFEFQGFVIITATDVTEQEMVSSIRQSLISSEAIKDIKYFENIQNKMRNLFRVPDLIVTIAALKDNNILVLNTNKQMDVNCVYQDSDHLKKEDFIGSLYETAVLSGKPVISSDIDFCNCNTAIESKMISNGIRSTIVAPLKNEEETVGIISLASRISNSFNTVDIMKLEEVLPLFSMSVKRSLEELDSRLQAIIQQQFTAIHPSVEWRFQQAALKYFDQGIKGQQPEMEDIFFENVYPLYSATDIRGSSNHRNAAIQSDLLRQMTLVYGIIQNANDERPLPILEEILFRLGQYIHEVESVLTSGAEIEIVNFMKYEIDPVLHYLKDFNEKMKSSVKDYFDIVDSEFGTIYDKRRDFDESVEGLNRTISAFLDVEQIDAQDMFPHYFEKQSTDGVDFNIYIGDSMSESRTFNEIYLKNMRLWQLIIMCKIAHLSSSLKTKLMVPLETTHLIVVQDMPITVGFHLDEKNFHVEGAYNIRYEIMKKRIDKAVIKDSGERLTQPDAIAIVYSQEKEAREYTQYVEYLQAQKYLKDDIEDVELGDLQGIQGLRALRVYVNLEAEMPGENIRKEVEKASLG